MNGFLEYIRDLFHEWWAIGGGLSLIAFFIPRLNDYPFFIVAVAVTAFMTAGYRLRQQQISSRNAQIVDAKRQHETEIAQANSRVSQLEAEVAESGRLGESLSQYEQVIKLDPRVADGQFGYAIALFGLRRYQEARDRLTEGMKAYPDQPAFGFSLARLLAAAPDDRVRDGRQAMEVMQALSDAQRRVDFGETMAMVFAEVGQYEEAAAWQREGMSTAKRAGRNDIAQRMAEHLKLYETRKPYRTP